MRVTEQAHRAVRQVVKAGDHVIDATAGNGHDTLFLARLVGPQGKVTAIDVQDEAIESTRRRLHEDGIVDDRALLVQDSHSSMQRHLDEPVTAVMFNLGYRPGGDHRRTTSREETVVALAMAWSALRIGGILSVVCYRGHPGAAEEAEGVCEFARALMGAEVEFFEKEKTEAGPFLVTVLKSAPARDLDSS